VAKYVESKRDTELFVAGSLEGLLPAQAVLAELGRAPGDNGPPTITADGAYHDTRQLDALEPQGVACFVPEDRTAHRAAPGVSPEYQADQFAYEESTDTLRCPQGHRLTRRKRNNGQTAAVYQAPPAAGQSCPARSQCCPKSQSGRCVNRSLYQERLDTIAQRLETDAGRRRTHARWVVCEGAFARLNGLPPGGGAACGPARVRRRNYCGVNSCTT
jgi:hypothetical protein